MSSTYSQQDIESRLALLDQRLRNARAENSALRERLSPSPAQHNHYSASRHDYNTGSIYNLQQQQAPAAVGYAPGSGALAVATARGPVASPRLESSSYGTGTNSPARNSSPTRGATATAPSSYNDPTSDLMNGQLRELQTRLSSTNRAILEREKEIAEQARRKTIVAAETAKAVDDADLRVRDAQERVSRNTHHLSDLQSKRAALARQLDEVSATTQRTEHRLHELDRTKAALDAKVGEANVALREREAAVHEETDAFRLVRQRLERRYADLEEENHAASERLRRIEAQFATQQQQWREEEDTLQRECDEAATLLDEMTSRLQTLKSELADRQRDSEEQRAVRERRAAELQKQQEDERKKDSEVHKAGLENRERALIREREEVLSGLRQQIEMLNQQLDRKKTNRDTQDATNAELERAMSDLNGKLEQKQQLQERVRQAEERLLTANSERDHRREDLTKLKEMVSQRDAQIQALDKTAQRMAHLLEEEKRVRGLVSDLAKQLNDVSLSHDVERANAERELKRLRDDKRAADEQVASVSGEIERTRAAGNADVELIRRKNEQLRADIQNKEQALRKALQDNASKQSQLQHYEDERRRTEREAVTRRAAASGAAKAAYSELQ